MIHDWGWHEWLCHTNFSFLLGASHPIEMLQSAHDAGYTSLGITDMDGVYGIARAYRERQVLKRRGVPITLNLRYGAELHLQPDHEIPVVLQDTLVFFALNRIGYYHLNSLITKAHEHGKSSAHISLDTILEANLDGIAVLQPMRGLIRHRSDQAKQSLYERTSQLKDKLKHNFFLVISRHLNPAEDAWINDTLRLSQGIGVPTLFSQDIFFHHPSKKPLSDLLHAIRTNLVIDHATQHCFVNNMRHPQSLAAIESLYRPIPGYKQALKQAKQLDEQFEFDLDQLIYQYPKEMIPTGMTPQSYLESLTWSYAKQWYGTPLPASIKKVLTHELALVKQLNFADYFLTVYDIVFWARKQDILCQGRGSAANSAICFVLGITSVDPLNFELLFERFISAERGDPPDIDVDFEHERREEVIQYIYQRFGRDKSAMVCNVITFKSKGALRACGKALGFPEPILSGASKRLQTRQFRRKPLQDTVTLVRQDFKTAQGHETDARYHDQQNKAVKHKEQQNQSEPTLAVELEHRWALWPEMAKQLLGFPRHLGIHSGGFVISDKPMNWICPQEPATMEGRTVMAWCKEDIEGLGFFKIDVLALGGLTLIRKCLQYIHQHYGKKMSMADIPDDDPKTYAMIQQADTVGTFQIESRAQMSFLPKHKPKNFYDLVVQVAIIRPGPIQGGMIHPYLKRRRGLEPVTFPDPRLKPILKRTFGVPIFQEQVMRVAIAVGGFTPGEANELRKSIGAFTLKTDPEFWIDKLKKGMSAHQVPDDFINSILGHIKGFSSYGFPESHAASFAYLAYVTSYLKCHYPEAFFTAILNAQPMGFYVPDTLIKTAQSLGVTILPICALHSDWDHQLEKLPDADSSKQVGSAKKLGSAKQVDPTKHVDSNQQHANLTQKAQPISPLYGIRLGFRLIRGLSRSGIQHWLSLKEQLKPHLHADIDLFTLIKGSGLSRVDFTCLAAADAFHRFGLKRKDAIWLAESSPFKDTLTSDFDHEYQASTHLFPKETEVERMQLDYLATSTSLGKHPALLMKTHAWVYPIQLSKLSLSESVRYFTSNKKMVTVFGMVTSRQAPPTAKGMVFLTLWDETGHMNLVIRPDVYTTYQSIIDSHAFLCAKGICQKQDDAVSVFIKHIYKPAAGEVLSYKFKHTIDVSHEVTKVRRYM